MDNELQYMLGHSLLRPFVFVLKPMFICLHTDSKRREQEAGNQKAETSATEWLTSPAGWVLCVGAEVLDGHIAGSHWFLLSAHLHRPPVVEGRTCLQNRFVSDSQKWMLQKEKKRKEKGAKTCVHPPPLFPCVSWLMLRTTGVTWTPQALWCHWPSSSCCLGQTGMETGKTGSGEDRKWE